MRLGKRVEINGMKVHNLGGAGMIGMHIHSEDAMALGACGCGGLHALPDGRVVLEVVPLGSVRITLTRAQLGDLIADAVAAR